MSYYQIDVDMVFTGDVDPDHLESVFDAVADAAAEITAGIDADASLNKADCTLTIHLSLEDDSDESAFGRGMSAARTAIHVAGGPTAGWEKITLHSTPDDELTAV